MEDSKIKKVMFCWICVFLTVPCGARIITVDDDGAADFNNIQAAINDANDHDIVVVFPGAYTGEGNRDIEFLGKAITVRSINPNNPVIVAVTVIDCNGTQEDPHRGFYFHGGESPDSTLSGITITSGYALNGGGIMCRESSSPTITNCIIRGNLAGYPPAGDPPLPTAPTEGGGIYCSSSSSPTIANCLIADNKATAGGGAISSYDSAALVQNCVIRGNWAIMNGGGITLYKDNMSIQNCVISGNIAFIPGGLPSDPIYGGGIYSSSSTPTIENCTLSGNSTAAKGGGIYVKGGDVTVTNSLLWDNYASEGAEIAIREGAFGPASLSLSYSDILGEQEGVYLYGDSTLLWGPGNIEMDPCFVEPGKWVDVNDPNTVVEPNDPNAVWVDGDYHLRSEGWRLDTRFAPPRWGYDYVTSRCIDAGNPGSPLGGELLTIPPDPGHVWGRNLRINMGTYGGTAQASMPPYDWALLADLTNDGIVNGSDFAHQAKDWVVNGAEQPGDLNRDSIVDTNDVGLFVDDWLKTTSWYE